MMSQIKKAVVAVLLPREHLPFIREWCLHHLDQGWSVFLYDNTGSQGSQRGSSVFKYGHLQQQNVDKRGNRYGTFTEAMTDEEVSQALEKEVEGLDVRIVPWQPLDHAGQIVHGQVEAYVHFIREFGDDYRWASFIDADEYLHLGAGLSWGSLLEELEGWECHRIMFDGHIYEARWTPEGEPRPLADLACCGRQVMGNKNIVRPDKVIRADIHWGWMMEGSDQYATIDSLQLHFRHYKGEKVKHVLSLKNSPAGPASESHAVREQLPDTSGRASSDACPPALKPWRISRELESFITSKLPELFPTPHRILELGPGYSTLVFSAIYPDAEITAVEHDRDWLAKELTPLCERKNIELVLAPLEAQSRWYSLQPEQLPHFDVLLVDGPPGFVAPKVRERAAILRGNLSPGALVILNNTDRKDEASSIGVWREAGLEIQERGKGFTVLRVPLDSESAEIVAEEASLEAVAGAEL